MRSKFSLIMLAAGILLAYSGLAMAFDVAISSQANWWSQAAADKEMAALSDAIKSKAKVTIFPADKQADLATWVKNNTKDGENDILILCGQFPKTIYAAGNTQKDDSLAELFLNGGNTILNTGDYMFYVVDSAGTNGENGLKTMMNLETTMWDDDTAVVVTNAGKNYTPSLKDFKSDRPFHLDELKAPWKAELVLAQNAAGTRADPAIVKNTTTNGMLGIFFQTASQDTDPRAKVMSEFINSYFSTTPVKSAGSISSTWGAIKEN